MHKTPLGLLLFAAILIAGCQTRTASNKQPSPAFVPAPKLLNQLERLPDDHPLVVMTLLKFENAQGHKAYESYASERVSALRKLGGELLFFGKGKPHKEHEEGSRTVLGLTPNPWDYMVFERYPSRKDYRQLIESEALTPTRTAAEQHLTAISVYALNGTPRSGKEDVYPRSKAETVTNSDLPAGKTHYEINLLQFKPDGGESVYYDKYAVKVMPMLREISAKVVFGLKPELRLAGEEDYHRVILVSYPSTKVFTDMIYSDAYAAISPDRTKALNIGHLFGFENAASSVER